MTSLTILQFERNCLTKKEALRAVIDLYKEFEEEGISGLVIAVWNRNGEYDSFTSVSEDFPLGAEAIPGFVQTILESDENIVWAVEDQLD